MNPRSFLTRIEETEATVEEIREKVTETERECSEQMEELTELDTEFRSALAAGADGELERTRLSMELKQRYQEFRVKWTALVERLRQLQLLLIVERGVPDGADETKPIRELEVQNIDASEGSDTVRPLSDALDRDEVEATVDRINDAVSGDSPFRDQLVTAVLEEDETPPVGRSLGSMEPDSDERRERMVELLRQDETPSVHLWDLLAELDGAGRGDG